MRFKNTVTMLNRTEQNRTEQNHYYILNSVYRHFKKLLKIFYILNRFSIRLKNFFKSIFLSTLKTYFNFCKFSKISKENLCGFKYNLLNKKGENEKSCIIYIHCIHFNVCSNRSFLFKRRRRRKIV